MAPLKNRLKVKKNNKRPLLKLTNNKQHINAIHGIIHVKLSFNNTIVTLTDLLGNVKSWVSCGSVGFKGAKRSSRFAGLAAIEKLCEKVQGLNYKRIILHLNGLGRARNACVKSIKKSGLDIYFIKDFTPVSFNGCRPSKLRRL